MSEEENKEKPNYTANFQSWEMKPITAQALTFSIAAFIGLILLVPAVLWIQLYVYDVPPPRNVGVDISRLIYTVFLLMSGVIGLCILIGLILSLVALFTEPNKFFRWLPLAFIVVGYGLGIVSASLIRDFLGIFKPP